MEALALHTGFPMVHLEDNKSFIYVVKDKIVIYRVKHIDIPVCFLHFVFNGIFVPKGEKSSIVRTYMCNKPCSNKIIS